MYTRCRNCRTIYEITTEELRFGRGRANCSKCHKHFNTLLTLSNNVADVSVNKTKNIPTLALENAFIPDESERAPLPWEKRTKSPSGAHTFPWGLAICALIEVFIFQIIIFDGSRLANNSQLRPWLEKTCNILFCSLPTFKNLEAINVVDHELEETSEDFLTLNFVLNNASRFSQNLPRIELSLQKANGELFAQRVFNEKQLLPGEFSNYEIKSGEDIEIDLEIIRPEEPLGGYRIKIL